MEKNRTSQLQFLRFAAILLIFAWHATIKSIASVPHGYMARWNGANSAVVFFFVLSGMLTGLRLAEKGSEKETDDRLRLPDVWQYMKSKLLRFYPLYLVVTLVSVMFSDLPLMIIRHDYAGAKPLFFTLIRHLLLVQAWYKADPADYFAFSEVGWFLSAIMFLYLLSIPLRIAAVRIRRTFDTETSRIKAQTVYALAGITSIVLCVLYCLILRNTDTEFTEYVFPPSRVFEYIAGMALGLILHPFCVNTAYNGRTRILFSIMEIASPAIWILFLFLPLPEWGFRITNWLIPVIYTLVVFTMGRGVLSALFRTKLFVYLGGISFAFYLIHSMVIDAYVICVPAAALESDTGKTFAVIFCFALSLIMASIVSRKAS